MDIIILFYILSVHNMCILLQSFTLLAYATAVNFKLEYQYYCHLLKKLPRSTDVYFASFYAHPVRSDLSLYDPKFPKLAHRMTDTNKK